MADQKIDKAPRAIYDGELKIGDILIPCYVLEDERRILFQRAMVSGLGMSRGSSGGSGGDRLAKFVAGKALSPFVSNELAEVTDKPFKFITTKGQIAYGYEAMILADICEAVLDARNAGALQAQQMPIADRCEILLRGFAKIGIVALVDEATGFQYVRARRNLEEILEQYIAKEWRAWTKTFPDEFYEQLFRLRGWRYMPLSVKRPKYVGILTNDIVYQRLAPGVLDELKRKNPKTPTGHRKRRHFQWLTEDVGDSRLREHLASVMTLMRASTTWNEFKRLLERSLPKVGDTYQILFPDEEMDGGK